MFCCGLVHCKCSSALRSQELIFEVSPRLFISLARYPQTTDLELELELVSEVSSGLRLPLLSLFSLIFISNYSCLTDWDDFIHFQVQSSSRYPFTPEKEIQHVIERRNPHLGAGKEEGATSSNTSKKDFLTAPLNKETQDVSGKTSITGQDTDNDTEKQELDTAADEVPPRDITGWKWAVVVAAILSSTFLFALDNTIVADVQPVIVTRFDAVSKLSWLSVAFLIGAAATNLVWGKVFGQFNAKWTYILCVLLFEAGSALCGGAPTINALIVGRAICGVGGSGMYVGVMTLLSVTTTIHERPMYVGGTGLTWGLGTVLGPIIGGAFTDSSAGWVCYLNLLQKKQLLLIKLLEMGLLY